MKRKSAVTAGALSALLLAACSAPQLVDMSAPMKDGQFEGASNPDNQGAVGHVTITVKDGKIADAKYVTLRKDGSAKDANYGKSSDGQIGNEEYYKSAQKAVASYGQYAHALVEKQNPDEIAVISGATVGHSQFIQAAARAILKAQGREDDGTVDSVTVPDLELDESDY
ncbi:FMN-binding protein [Gleimia hominis]|uniref:FMN-binding protein n=1 Tax=Gleimia hominis TaxID=595468 RepID=UPI000C806EEC|nr:FMN-binding protein [Gleimia hominis]WIK64659.1 FMN-binding protein [Gleimia hominis]